jgi:hypothetical protein
MNKFIQKIKSFFNKQKEEIFVYYIDGQKFAIHDYNNIPWKEISSPDENTPAYENLLTGYKEWVEKGYRYHRLTGPARIHPDGASNSFWLNDKYYENVKDWFKDHPNPDLYFNAINLPETDRVLWFLQN